MAICKFCGKEMKDDINTSCFPKIKISGKVYDRKFYGHPLERFDTSVPCHDCNCKKGEYHHYGCDVEKCPICNGQLLMHIVENGYCNVAKGYIEALVDEDGNEHLIPEDFGSK